MSQPIGYEAIKAPARELGRSVASLITLAPANDPFYAGSPSSRARGEWFAGKYERLGCSAGVHPRRIHYLLVAQPTPELMHAITEELQAEAPANVDGWPEPAAGKEDPNPLFDIRREYLQQIDRYKQQQGKSVPPEGGAEEGDEAA